MENNKKYPGLNPDDNFWNDYHRSRGLMTNQEFFTSNGKGGFYEGMEWSESRQEWIPDAKTREKEYRREQLNPKCWKCGFTIAHCECE